MNASARTLFLLIVVAVTSFTAQSCRADCFDTAAKYEHVNPLILRGIATVESQNNPHATHRNKNHTVDFGMMQINSIHLKELNKRGVHRRDLMNACKNIYTGAWLLKREVVKYGDTWKAVGGYHSETPHERDRYANKIRFVTEKLAAIDIFRNQ
jgi:lysozyme-related protein Hpa2